MRHGILCAIVAAGAVLASGCSSNSGSGGDAVKLFAVNLDDVLDSFELAMKAKDPKPAAAPAAASAPSVAAASAPSAEGDAVASAAPDSDAADGEGVVDDAKDEAANAAAPEVAEDADKTGLFLKTFASELNKRKLDPVHTAAVYIRDDGAIEGFRDINKDGTRQSATEAQLFWLEIDAPRKRVIVSQKIGGQEYRRPYRTSGLGMGLMGGYMLGRMMGRQRGFYSRPGRTRPRYGTMKMSPKGYHKSAMSKAKSAAGAKARSKGGSKGFKGGK